MDAEPADYDGAWKETLEQLWRPFLTLCFPRVATAIDWNPPVEFLDQELREVVRDAESGRQFVDKLARVTRRDGAEQWVLVHLEIQSQRDPNLPARMYQYHQRLTDRYARPVASMAILADEDRAWRPNLYASELWGCRLRFEFPVCKLLDFEDDYLTRSDNPVALVIAAQRAAQRTVLDPNSRKQVKLRLIRELYDRGYERQDVLEVFRLIDWMIALPRSMEVEFRQELTELQKEKAMPYITSIERLSREEGREEGRLEGLESGRIAAARELVLEAVAARFEAVPGDLGRLVDATSDEALLRQWHRLAVTLPSISAFRESLQIPSVDR